MASYKVSVFAMNVVYFSLQIVLVNLNSVIRILKHLKSKAFNTPLNYFTIYS